ncbi:alpha/beta hydrolase [Alicyclobacillus sp. SO9]|uniref:alpha/beta hydrolase n=1 Tax=Alicyclobacillus sp. SO9 TaxID=2665646 RepID=UPI0018E7C5C5|nr:alpha/beta hydrolase [Alicyclobacillus sp. SO9]QQE77514.1 alpha/beta hydrolase [Alicyclobacillus sp. SO9]
MEESITLTQAADLTSQGLGVYPDAEALVYARPTISVPVPGVFWHGEVAGARAVLRLPHASRWNGKLLIGGVPAVRTEFSLDLLLSDLALQKGYAFAACDKATPGLVLRDTNRTMEEWGPVYKSLIEYAFEQATRQYGCEPSRTYMAGLSNGGYVTRIILEKYPHLLDGAVEWEGVFWHPESRHLMTTLPVFVGQYPLYKNWRGDTTTHEQSKALDKLLEAGLHPSSEPFWDTYFMMYWVVSLWLYGRSLDPEWPAFNDDWSNDWLRDPSPLADYPWYSRSEVTSARLQALENSGRVTKPLLSVAGNWDCLVPFRHNAAAYAEHVKMQGFGKNHRLYEIDGGNHVDGMLKSNWEGQQPVQPYFEAALGHLEAWVERSVQPPESGKFTKISEFALHPDKLLSVTSHS